MALTEAQQRLRQEFERTHGYWHPMWEPILEHVPEQFEAYQKAAKERLFAIVEKIQSRNAYHSEEEVLRDVTEAVEEVRQERYDRGK